MCPKELYLYCPDLCFPSNPQDKTSYHHPLGSVRLYPGATKTPPFHAIFNATDSEKRTRGTGRGPNGGRSVGIKADQATEQEWTSPLAQLPVSSSTRPGCLLSHLLPFHHSCSFPNLSLHFQAPLLDHRPSNPEVESESKRNGEKEINNHLSVLKFLLQTLTGLPKLLVSSFSC